MNVDAAEILPLILSWVAGAALGLIFFGGLRWTVERGLSSGRAALWFSGSLILRLSIVLTGFYLVSALHFDRLSACLLGFITAQIVVIFQTRSRVTPSAGQTKETNHASLS